DSIYRRKIHHFDNDKHTGVLYCKQQKKEQTSSEIMTRTMFRALYPESCGYKYVIGGTTKNLRESTTLEKVKQFHEKFYRPENFTVLIMGKIEHCKIFQALLPLEKKLSLKKKNDIFKRPWQTSINQLTENVIVDVELPCSEKTNAEVYVAWRGPSVVTQMYEYHGCKLLVKYIVLLFNAKQLWMERSMPELYNENILPVNIKYDFFIHSVSILRVRFSNVLGRIDLIKQSLDNEISKLCTTSIDMKIIRKLIRNIILERQCKLKSNPHAIIQQSVFDHIVYGNTNDDLNERLNTIRQLKKLQTESKTYFVNLAKTYFRDAPTVVVKGKPSSDEYRMVKNEKIYINKHIAKESIPTKILTSVPIPGIDSITFYQIENYTTET
ncbi:uncharacterized protein C05D11.1-like, partial [Pseudomyrmex gracilis]